MFKWVQNPKSQEPDLWFSGFFGKKEAEVVRGFHESFPDYKPTPLVELKNLAREIGLGSVYVKDESFRFGLNAFKALGSSFALGKYIALNNGLKIEDVGLNDLINDDFEKFRCYTATDGNHGRGLAWAARQFHQNASVYMPKNTVAMRVENVARENASVSVRDLGYDDTVSYVKGLCENDPNGILFQDTAWEGYTEIPSWIMQGYLTLIDEVCEALSAGHVPTHVVLQAGVGSFAATLTAYLMQVFEEAPPIVIIAEPNEADCYYQSMVAGKRFRIDNDLDTIMAGLACGEPSTLAWDILSRSADFFVSVPDEVAKVGMRVLAKPLGDDQKVISGESGAVGVGLIYEVMKREPDFKKAAGLDENSVVLLISTEGDTDPENYKKIVEQDSF
jgi:diaminopropionate ammonia-lyase